MTFTNGDKRLHGQKAQNSLYEILEIKYEEGHLKEKPTKEYRIGKKGYSNKKQFYAPFLIEFLDGTKWVLFSTTSMRTDRIKGQQWDALNLKEIDNNITAVYLVYPDGVEPTEKENFISQNNKYKNLEEYSAIDAIISQEEICNMIEEYAIKDLDTGQKKSKQGTAFEYRVEKILNYPENLDKWKNETPTIEGMHYNIFKDIVNCFGLDSVHVQSIFATSDKKKIGSLPTRGQVKTDVLVTIKKDDNSTHYYTISCKRSNRDLVSVHEYNADTFADVLDNENAQLRFLLNKFQECGSRKSFGEKNCNELTEAIAPYIDKLALWVLGGHEGKGNPETQWANYILTYDNNDLSISIHQIKHYCEILISKVKGNFGTPFSWTYPSKKRGKSIQLKCKILK